MDSITQETLISSTTGVEEVCIRRMENNDGEDEINQNNEISVAKEREKACSHHDNMNSFIASPIEVCGSVQRNVAISSDGSFDRKQFSFPVASLLSLERRYIEEETSSLPSLNPAQQITSESDLTTNSGCIKDSSRFNKYVQDFMNHKPAIRSFGNLVESVNNSGEELNSAIIEIETALINTNTENDPNQKKNPVDVPESVPSFYCSHEEAQFVSSPEETTEQLFGSGTDSIQHESNIEIANHPSAYCISQDPVDSNNVERLYCDRNINGQRLVVPCDELDTHACLDEVQSSNPNADTANVGGHSTCRTMMNFNKAVNKTKPILDGSSADVYEMYLSDIDTSISKTYVVHQDDDAEGQAAVQAHDEQHDDVSSSKQHNKRGQPRKQQEQQQLQPVQTVRCGTRKRRMPEMLIRTPVKTTTTTRTSSRTSTIKKLSKRVLRSSTKDCINDPNDDLTAKVLTDNEHQRKDISIQDTLDSSYSDAEANTIHEVKKKRTISPKTKASKRLMRGQTSQQQHNNIDIIQSDVAFKEVQDVETFDTVDTSSNGNLPELEHAAIKTQDENCEVVLQVKQYNECKRICYQSIDILENNSEFETIDDAGMEMEMEIEQPGKKRKCRANNEQDGTLIISSCGSEKISLRSRDVRLDKISPSRRNKKNQSQMLMKLEPGKEQHSYNADSSVPDIVKHKDEKFVRLKKIARKSLIKNTNKNEVDDDEKEVDDNGEDDDDDEVIVKLLPKLKQRAAASYSICKTILNEDQDTETEAEQSKVDVINSTFHTMPPHSSVSDLDSKPILELDEDDEIISALRKVSQDNGTSILYLRDKDDNFRTARQIARRSMVQWKQENRKLSDSHRNFTEGHNPVSTNLMRESFCVHHIDANASYPQAAIAANETKQKSDQMCEEQNHVDEKNYDQIIENNLIHAPCEQKSNKIESSTIIIDGKKPIARKKSGKGRKCLSVVDGQLDGKKLVHQGLEKTLDEEKHHETLQSIFGNDDDSVIELQTMSRSTRKKKHVETKTIQIRETKSTRHRNDKHSKKGKKSLEQEPKGVENSLEGKVSLSFKTTESQGVLDLNRTKIQKKMYKPKASKECKETAYIVDNNHDVRDVFTRSNRRKDEIVIYGHKKRGAITGKGDDHKRSISSNPKPARFEATATVPQTKRKVGQHWTQYEIWLLNEGIKTHGPSKFKALESFVGTRTRTQIAAMIQNVRRKKTSVTLEALHLPRTIEFSKSNAFNENAMDSTNMATVLVPNEEDNEDTQEDALLMSGKQRAKRSSAIEASVKISRAALLEKKKGISMNNEVAEYYEVNDLETSTLWTAPMYALPKKDNEHFADASTESVKKLDPENEQNLCTSQDEELFGLCRPTANFIGEGENLEETKESYNADVLIQPKMVVCENVRNHEGNKAYYMLVNQAHEEFKAGTAEIKTRIVSSICKKFVFISKSGSELDEEQTKRRVYTALILKKKSKTSLRQLNDTCTARMKIETVAANLKEDASTGSVPHQDGDTKHSMTAVIESELSCDTSRKQHFVDMQFYVEELAYHYFAERSEEEKLFPLAEAPPMPKLPTCIWSFDKASRVLLADFRKCSEINPTDKLFLAQMMQRDDITLISDGLLSNLDPKLWNLQSIENAFSGKPYHKFRRFNRSVGHDGFVSYVEQDKFVSMKVSDYIRYLSLLQSGDEETLNSSFTFSDADGVLHDIGRLLDVVFYMIDIDMPKYVPILDKNYKKSFRIPEMLPGGGWCMMSSLPESARPFMGPNCYITPGGGYTQVHQDGHGTVDSGHSNLCGFNEVIMLRRLPECHKLQACRKMPILSGNRTEHDAIRSLYRLPHDDGREERLAWPTSDTIEQWKTLNYYPSVFILKPGQHVHINKGRLHAFRKLTCDILPQNDCHHLLRTNIVEQFQLKKSPLCLSVAFDWMYWGFDKEGINREVASIIECAGLCRKYKCKSLAIPETVLLNAGMQISAKYDGKEMLSATMLGFDAEQDEKEITSPLDVDIISGILPSLRYVYERDKSAVNAASLNSEDRIYKGVKLKVAKKPDTCHDPLTSPTDPYGSDYFCMICNQELSNSYFHCNGCEAILNRDFNICGNCYGEGEYLKRIQIHPTSNKWYSDVNHLGHNVMSSNSRGCPCHAGRCRACLEPLCKQCSCKCHKVFTNQFRFIDPVAVETMLKKCEKIANGAEVKYAHITEARLNRKPIDPDLLQISAQ